ncbi:MAG TPA: sugar phosphate isomerase/epimerase family protein [Phycisphaeraceae bacterium]
MLIGAMNHPAQDVLDEIAWMARLELDFIDLTLEPPAAAPQQIDPPAVRAALDKAGLGVVGHTAYYLPLASPFEQVRRAALEEMRRCLETFAQLGVAWVNVHPDARTPLHDRRYAVKRNLQSLRELLTMAQDLGVGLMVENIPGWFNSANQLADLLDPLPHLALHLDIGHCNLRVLESTADELIHAYADRLQHVHLHDNKGGMADLHLPLGTGTVDYAKHLGTLKAAGYDGTITLEVFSPDSSYLAHSRDLLRQAWDRLGA